MKAPRERESLSPRSGISPMCCAIRASPTRPISARFPICFSSRWTRSASPRSAKPPCSGRRALGRHPRPVRRGAERDLCQAARQPVEAGRRHRRDLPEGPERDPGPGQTEAPRRPDRQRGLARPAGGRKGQHLRRPARPQRRGRQIRRRTIFHAAPADRGDGAGGRSAAAADRARSGLRHGGLSARRLGAHEGFKASRR